MATDLTLYFYDLETTGVNPREARIMQFAGQRTDLSLQPIGEPHNVLIKLTEDVVPDPDAILITGITPQQTIAEGVTEAEFLKLFHAGIAQPGTIFVGFNSVRFDDEFMRFLHYRNFYDPYEWQWKNDRSRWDLLDVVRMTRALRPDGIKWPFDSSGKPTNRLELLTSVNGLDHNNAHDALSDVRATIALAQLIRQKQPKLFNYLLDLRGKSEVSKLVLAGAPFIYSSGKYDSAYEKTTVAAVLMPHPHDQGALVFDLRFNPEDYFAMTPVELAEAWTRRWGEEGVRLPIKTLKFNRCPAVAPLSVLDDASKTRLGLDNKKIEKHFKSLDNPGFKKNVTAALSLLDKQQQTRLLENEQEVDAQLYEGFFSDSDKKAMHTVLNADSAQLSALHPRFDDQRLSALFPLYKARNYPKSLSDEDRAVWERFKERKLLSGKQNSRLARYFTRLAELEADKSLSDAKRYLLEELQLHGQSIMPEVAE